MSKSTQQTRGRNEADLRRAIAAGEAALIYCTEQSHPERWADIHAALGRVYCGLGSTADREDNLNRAVGSYQSALRVYSAESHPMKRAAVLNQLGQVYLLLSTTGSSSHNLMRAITCFKSAFASLPPDQAPLLQALLHANLGDAYTKLRLPKDPGAYFRIAQSHYESALVVFTEKKYPKTWARLQTGLGTASLLLAAVSSVNDGEKDLLRAVSCLEDSLRVYGQQAPLESFAFQWANSRRHLGPAYSRLPVGDWNENLRTALAHYEAALTIYLEKDHPLTFGQIQVGLAELSEKMNAHTRAVAHYQKAVRAFASAGILSESEPRRSAELDLARLVLVK